MKTRTKIVGLSLALASLAAAEHNCYWLDKAFISKSWRTEKVLLQGADLPPVYKTFLNHYEAKVTYIDGSLQDFGKENNIKVDYPNKVFASWVDSNKTLYYSHDVSHWISWDLNTPLHEIGHIIYCAAGVGLTKSFAREPFVVKDWKQNKNRLFASTYYRNEKEWFAEGFAWYYNSDHTRSLLFSHHKNLYGLIKLLENVLQRGGWKDQPKGSQMVYSNIVRGELSP